MIYLEIKSDMSEVISTVKPSQTTSFVFRGGEKKKGDEVRPIGESLIEMDNNSQHDSNSNPNNQTT